MHIIQITDLHVGIIGEDAHGVDVRQNFLSVLAAAVNAKPDLLVLTGDLCLRDPHKEVYEWMKEHLDASGLRYEVIPGNHDESQMLATVFGRMNDLKEGELYFQRIIDGRKLLFLDSAVGELSPRQMHWLREQLEQQEKQAIVFVHHPIVNGEVLFMEQKYAMRGREPLQEVLHEFAFAVAVFCGHYHVDKVIVKGNISCHITPSCYVQIKENTMDFEADHHRIAYRSIRLNEAGWSSTVRYLEGHKA